MLWSGWIDVAQEASGINGINEHVGVERPEHPVAPAPDCPWRVAGIASVVGIEGQIEPMPGHVLSVAIVGPQPVKQFFHHVGTVLVVIHSCCWTGSAPAAVRSARLQARLDRWLQP